MLAVGSERFYQIYKRLQVIFTINKSMHFNKCVNSYGPLGRNQSGGTSKLECIHPSLPFVIDFIFYPCIPIPSNYPSVMLR